MHRRQAGNILPGFLLFLIPIGNGQPERNFDGTSRGFPGGSGVDFPLDLILLKRLLQNAKRDLV